MGELLRTGQGILLDFEGNAALEAQVSDYASQLLYVSGRAKVQLGLRAVLVRPDGFVAWAANQVPDGAEFQAAAVHWFVNKHLQAALVGATPALIG
jgi:hypothetical protein